MTIKELLLKHFPKNPIEDWVYFCTTRDGYCCFQKDRAENVFIPVNEIVDKDKIEWDDIHKRNKQLDAMWKDLELISPYYNMKQCPNITFHEAVPVTAAENYFEEC